MKTIGLFYAMNAAKTSHIAEKIREDLGGVKVIEVVLIEKAWQNVRGEKRCVSKFGRSENI